MINFARGGSAISLTEDVHPDNAALARRAARVVGLDMAGVDLLIPDIRVSWHESGAYICEVNAQPGLGHRHCALPIRAMVPGLGRPLVVLLVGAENTAIWLTHLSRQFDALGLSLGASGRDTVTANREPVHSGPCAPFQGGRILALSRDVDAMVIAVNDMSLIYSEMPAERCDALIIAGRHFAPTSNHAQTSPQEGVSQLIAHLLPACDGAVVVHRRGGVAMHNAAAPSGVEWHESTGNMAETTEKTLGLVMGFVQRRKHVTVVSDA